MMRTKDEILDSTREDIRGWGDGDTPSLWMEYRKLEVLIDVRDILVSIDKNFGSNIFDLARES